ncbi:hypothetical protein ON010_g8453 [Phytophthora cinnamomi]|nr:hypothetical protein ON010_g8453 [Phytophthora cinnamomi]
MKTIKGISARAVSNARVITFSLSPISAWLGQYRLRNFLLLTALLQVVLIQVRCDADRKRNDDGRLELEGFCEDVTEGSSTSAVTGTSYKRRYLSYPVNIDAVVHAKIESGSCFYCRAASQAILDQQRVQRRLQAHRCDAHGVGPPIECDAMTTQPAVHGGRAGLSIRHPLCTAPPVQVANGSGATLCARSGAGGSGQLRLAGERSAVCSAEPAGCVRGWSELGHDHGRHVRQRGASAVGASADVASAGQRDRAPSPERSGATRPGGSG